MFIVHIEEPEALAAHLHSMGWLHDGEEIVSLTKPGEGNMNYVLRVDTGTRTFIIKQSRPYVEKYPHISAPANRMHTEAAFYQKINAVGSLRDKMPACVGFDAANNILVLEDLGQSTDFTFLYTTDTRLQNVEHTDLLTYLSTLHRSFKVEGGHPDFANADMKRLNHEHIFHYPFMEENGFDLDVVTHGLQQYSMKFKQDKVLKSRIKAVGDLYLSEGDYLLHGDFYPGSWLQTVKGVRVIDPEFTFYGPREFDLGVWKAHLMLSQHEDHVIDKLHLEYDVFSDLDVPLLNVFAGIESMRRLIGLAQLPLLMEISKKMEFLDKAYQWIKS